MASREIDAGHKATTVKFNNEDAKVKAQGEKVTNRSRMPAHQTSATNPVKVSADSGGISPCRLLPAAGRWCRSRFQLCSSCPRTAGTWGTAPPPTVRWPPEHRLRQFCCRWAMRLQVEDTEPETQRIFVYLVRPYSKPLPPATHQRLRCRPRPGRSVSIQGWGCGSNEGRGRWSRTEKTCRWRHWWSAEPLDRPSLPGSPAWSQTGSLRFLQKERKQFSKGRSETSWKNARLFPQHKQLPPSKPNL